MMVPTYPKLQARTYIHHPELSTRVLAVSQFANYAV